MSKVKYRIVSSSGEDPEYPVTELLTPSPQSKGWQSPKFCDYPLELTLEFSAPVRAKQLQFLSHQFKISSKIEIFIYLPRGPESGDIKFSKLGYLLLDSNERSEYQARELKSVYLDNPCLMIKLLFHKCHPNKYNLFNQVGLIALSVFGDYLSAPANNAKPKSNFDAIEYETQFDENTLAKIRALNVAKERAVAADDFEEAKRLKEAIERLKQIGVQLQRLEERKAIAVSNEDYDSARVIKEEIERLRSAVAPNSLLGKYGGVERNVSEQINFPQTRQMPQSNFINHEDQGQFSMPISKPSREQAVAHSRKAKPQLQEQFQEQEEEFEEQKEFELKNNSTINPRALKGKANNVDEQIIPALQNKGNVENSQFEDEGNLLEAEPLSLAAAKKAENMLPFFGEQLCRKIFSKQWPLREEGLKELEGSVDRATEMNFRDAVLAAISNSIGDKISQVSSKSASLLGDVCRVGKMPVRGEAISFAETILPIVMAKVGDANNRTKEIVDQTILEMADCQAFGVVSVSQGLIKGTKGKESPKNIAARLSLLKEIVERQNIPPNLQNSIASFSAKSLDHSNADVRNAAVSCLVSLYRVMGNGLRSHLSSVRPAQMEILEAEFSGGGHFQMSQEKPTHTTKVETNINRGKQKPSAGAPPPKNLDPSKICDFCDKYDPSFSDPQKLDLHLWKECPMLILCNLCGQVVEIASLSSHLLDECEYRSTNRKCPRCREAIHVTEFKGHTEEMTCLPCKPAELANRCPLCHEDIGPGELGWKRHLIHEGCANNERGY